MSGVLRILLRLFRSNQKEHKVFIGGLDYSGRTTLLYKLKLGEVVQTIPTIGFNVETVECPSNFTGKRLTLICWDVGGCDKISPLYKYYIRECDAVVWVVDSCDRDRILESFEILDDLDKSMLHDENRANGCNVPVLILANKQDLPNAMKPSEVASYFKSITKGRLSHVASTTNLAPLADSGLPEAFDWLKAALNASCSGPNMDGPSIVSVPPIQLPGSKANLQTRFESYLSRAASDTLKEAFLQQFESFNLPSWDHYTHLRIAYTILTEHGRRKGKDIIFDGIRNYIENSRQTTGRSFHITMTYFWIQMVHFGLESLPSAFDGASSVSKEQLLESSIQSPEIIIRDHKVSNEEFCRFLIINPFVVDGNLWANYYSKEVMMSPAAKESVVLPDKKALPNLIVRDAVKQKT